MASAPAGRGSDCNSGLFLHFYLFIWRFAPNCKFRSLEAPPDFRLSQSSPASRLHEFIRYYSIMLRKSRVQLHADSRLARSTGRCTYDDSMYRTCSSYVDPARYVLHVSRSHHFDLTKGMLKVFNVYATYV